MRNSLITEVDPRIKFRDALDDKCVNLSKLAKKFGYCPSYISKVVGLKEPLHEPLRKALNEFLGTNIQ